MTRLTYTAEWFGELAAGIRPGYEKVTIQFAYDQPLDTNVIDYWREAIAEFYDGAHVRLTESENPR